MLGGVVFSVVLLFVASVAFLPTISAQDNTYSSENTQTPNTIQSLEQSFSLIEIFERSEFGVVSITVTKISDFGNSKNVGSGFVFDKNGHIFG